MFWIWSLHQWDHRSASFQLFNFNSSHVTQTSKRKNKLKLKQLVTISSKKSVILSVSSSKSKKLPNRKSSVKKTSSIKKITVGYEMVRRKKSISKTDFLESVVLWINLLTNVLYWLMSKVIIVKTVIYQFIWNMLNHSVGSITTVTIVVMITWLDRKRTHAVILTNYWLPLIVILITIF